MPTLVNASTTATVALFNLLGKRDPANIEEAANFVVTGIGAYNVTLEQTGSEATAKKGLFQDLGAQIGDYAGSRLEMFGDLYGLSNTALITKLHGEVYGGAPPSQFVLDYFNGLLTTYTAHYGKFPHAGDMSGFQRAVGALASDMIQQDFDRVQSSPFVTPGPLLTEVKAESTTWPVQIVEREVIRYIEVEKIVTNTIYVDVPYPVPGPTVYVNVPGPTVTVTVDGADPVFAFSAGELTGASPLLNGTGNLPLGDGTTPDVGLLRVEFDDIHLAFQHRPRQSDGNDKTYIPTSTSVEGNIMTGAFTVAAGLQSTTTGSFGNSLNRGADAEGIIVGSETKTFAQLAADGYEIFLKLDQDKTVAINHNVLKGVVQNDGTLDWISQNGGANIVDNVGNTFQAGNATNDAFRTGGVTNLTNGSVFTDELTLVKGGVTLAGIVSVKTLADNGWQDFSVGF